MAQYRLSAAPSGHPGLYLVSILDEKKNMIVNHPMPATARDTVEHFRLWLSNMFKPGDVIRVELEHFQDIEAALRAVQTRV
jgi:hypothetical protein